MSQLLIYTYQIPVKNVKKKRICQFSDTHLVEWDALSSPEEVKSASERTAQWLKGRFGFAQHYNEPCGEAQALPAKTFFHELLQASAKEDALILAGDVIDFHTTANSRFLEKELAQVQIPYISVCGNHDEPDQLPPEHPLAATGKPVQLLDLGDMVILGLDNSKRIITREQLDACKQVLSQDKPVLITMHIPIMTEGNQELLLQCGEYFQLNYAGCPEENLEFIETICANAHRIIAITTGHLHFNNVSQVCDGVTQYVSSQGLIGSLCVFEIGE